MDDQLTQALSLLIGAGASTLLLWGNFRWGGRRYKEERADELEHEREQERLHPHHEEKHYHIEEQWEE